LLPNIFKERMAKKMRNLETELWGTIAGFMDIWLGELKKWFGKCSIDIWICLARPLRFRCPLF
jgi:hypothetical protein